MTFRSRKAKGLLLPFAAFLLMTGCGPFYQAAQNPQVDDAGLEPPSAITKDVLDRQAEITAMGFVEPVMTQSLQQTVLDKYSNVDSAHVIPQKLLSEALSYYDANLGKIKNQSYLTIVDFSAFSGDQRLYVINMRDGSVSRGYVAHGSGSDPAFSGYATRFSNQSGSNASSLGFSLASETYEGSHGPSVRLDGLSSSNSNARSRTVVLHGASYVHEAHVKQGRSWGCLAVPMSERDGLVKNLSGGSLIYAGLSASSVDSPVASTPALPTPDAPSTPSLMKVAPLWEAARGATGKSWTEFSTSLILAEGANLLKGTSDMPNFCPAYSRLSTADKVNVWVYLISAVVKYESGFNPASRMKENLGTDSVTHAPVYSEGLLQLSYQDSRNYSFCNEFNWSADKTLSATSPSKTILDPYKNLRCGIRILNKIVGSHNAIAFNSGQYWSTLMPSRSPEHSIQALVHKMSICN